MTSVMQPQSFYRTTLVQGWFLSMRWLMVVVVGTFVAVSGLKAQDSTGPEGERQVIRKVAPVYPDLARRAHISGVVKLVAVVAPNGSVKSVEPTGGNPVLITAAENAVKQWGFAPAPQETRQMIELRFSQQ